MYLEFASLKLFIAFLRDVPHGQRLCLTGNMINGKKSIDFNPAMFIRKRNNKVLLMDHISLLINCATSWRQISVAKHQLYKKGALLGYIFPRLKYIIIKQLLYHWIDQ